MCRYAHLLVKLRYRETQVTHPNNDTDFHYISYRLKHLSLDYRNIFISKDIVSKTTIYINDDSQ
jgi:hypothetical protein